MCKVEIHQLHPPRPLNPDRGNNTLEGALMEDEDIIKLAGLGAFLVTYAGARGATEVADQVMDTIEDVLGRISNIPKNPVLKALGYGRKGGIL